MNVRWMSTRDRRGFRATDHRLDRRMEEEFPPSTSKASQALDIWEVWVIGMVVETMVELGGIRRSRSAATPAGHRRKTASFSKLSAPTTLSPYQFNPTITLSCSMLQLWMHQYREGNLRNLEETRIPSTGKTRELVACFNSFRSWHNIRIRAGANIIISNIFKKEVKHFKKEQTFPVFSPN